MTDSEQVILSFLQTSPETYFARREIARRAVKREVYEENPHWVDAPLASLLANGILEQNETALYRIKKDELLP